MSLFIPSVMGGTEEIQVGKIESVFLLSQVNEGNTQEQTITIKNICNMGNER